MSIYTPKERQDIYLKAIDLLETKFNFCLCWAITHAADNTFEYSEARRLGVMITDYVSERFPELTFFNPGYGPYWFGTSCDEEGKEMEKRHRITALLLMYEMCNDEIQKVKP
jgi:hypothetical protein